MSLLYYLTHIGSIVFFNRSIISTVYFCINVFFFIDKTSLKITLTFGTLPNIRGRVSPNKVATLLWVLPVRSPIVFCLVHKNLGSYATPYGNGELMGHAVFYATFRRSNFLSVP